MQKQNFVRKKKKLCHDSFTKPNDWAWIINVSKKDKNYFSINEGSQRLPWNTDSNIYI